MRFNIQNGKFHYVLEFRNLRTNQIEYVRISSNLPNLSIFTSPLLDIWNSEEKLNFGNIKYTKRKYNLDILCASDWCQQQAWIVEFDDED